MHGKITIPQFLGMLLMPISIILFFSSIGNRNMLQFPLAITVVLVANILLLSSDLSKNIIFLLFQGTYFIFLIAGPLINSLEGIDFFAVYSNEVVEKTYLCYWLAACAMWCYFSYTALNKKIRFRIRNSSFFGVSEELCKDHTINKIRYYSKILFYIAIVAYIVVTVDKILYRQIHSLQSYYAFYDVRSSMPTAVIKIADAHLIALSMFLATKPSKKEATMPIVLFITASVLTLLIGIRNIVILNILYLIVYFSIRSRDGAEFRLSKKIIKGGLVLSPVFVILLQAFDVFRRNVAFDMSEIKGLLSLSFVKDFFVSQSVSSYVLPNAIAYYTKLGGQPVPYTFGTVYTYLRQNMLVRFFTGTAAFSSNSVESAISGGNLGARLAYHLYHDTYLSGTGMGGHYVAELFVDFSYIGVVIGTLIVCMIIKKLSNATSKNYSTFGFAFALIAIKWIIYMPRDTYLSWVMQTFSFLNIAFVMVVMFLSRVRVPRRNTKNDGSRISHFDLIH